MSTFKVGDVVRLKSGGPEMTVKSVDDSCGEVVCNWMDFRYRKQVDRFEIAQLDLVRSESPPKPEPIGRTPGKWRPCYYPTLRHHIDNYDDMIVCESPERSDKEAMKHWPANARWICQIPAIERLFIEMSEYDSHSGHALVNGWQRRAQTILDAANGKSET